MGAIPCFYINLDRSTERMENFEAECERVGIKPIRIRATDNREITEEQKQCLFGLERRKMSIGLGETACFLSHRNLWQHIVDENLDWAYITEDDAHFSDNASLFFENADWLPQDADIVKAETRRGRISMSWRVRCRAHGHTLRLLKSEHYGTAGYFLSHTGAKRLLKLTQSRMDSSDDIMFNPKMGIMPQLTVYQMDKAISVQDDLVRLEDGHGYESTLELDRRKSDYLWLESNNLELPKPKVRPRGLALIWREIKRVINRNIRRFVVPLWKFITEGSIVKRIEIDGFAAPRLKKHEDLAVTYMNARNDKIEQEIKIDALS